MIKLPVRKLQYVVIEDAEQLSCSDAIVHGLARDTQHVRDSGGWDCMCQKTLPIGEKLIQRGKVQRLLFIGISLPRAYQISE